MPEVWRIAVLDSGLPDGCGWPVVAAQRFMDTGTGVRRLPVVSDPLGHGTTVSQAICGSAPRCELLIAQVLDAARPATAAAVAAALDWAVEAGAHLIHMSLGLREDRQVLAQAAAAAVAVGRIVVASTPARGEPTFPARYAGVIRATGDARCEPGQISALATRQADFGGCPCLVGPAATGPSTRPAGASLGAAHLSGFLASHVEPGLSASQVCSRLRELARYHGPEQRSPAGA